MDFRITDTLTGSGGSLRIEVSDMKYPVLLERSEEGLAVSVPGLPGCWSQGATEAEALANITSAIREYLEVVKDSARAAADPRSR